MLNQLRRKTEAGFTIIELLIVIAIIGILATLVLTNFQGAQAKGRDTVRKNDINSVYQKLEEYYNENGNYPTTLTATVLPGIDAEALTDEDGNAFVITTTDISATDPVDAGTPNGSTNEYAYAAYDCVTAAGVTTCGKYHLVSYLERDPNPWRKSSLN
jgi:prepilin-type N-terminal cleavage/methylation domain-containing protein